MREAAARGEDVAPQITGDGRLAILGTVIDLDQLGHLAETAKRPRSARPSNNGSGRRGGIGDPPKYPQSPSWETFDEDHEYQVIVHFPHHLDHELKATVRDGLFIIESLKHDAPNSFYCEFALPEQVVPSSLRRASNNSTFVFRFDKQALEASLAPAAQGT